MMMELLAIELLLIVEFAIELLLIAGVAVGAVCY